MIDSKRFIREIPTPIADLNQVLCRITVIQGNNVFLSFKADLYK